MEPENEEFVLLSWELLEHKVRYYKFNQPTITDEEYDKLEVKYLTLCKEHNYQNTLVHKMYPGFEDLEGGMMEIDETRPSVQAAIRKVLQND